MMQHFRSVHEKLKPYACTVQGCAAAFSQKYLLTRHLKRHEASGTSPGPLRNGPNAPAAAEPKGPGLTSASTAVVESVGSGGWLRAVETTSAITDALLLESRGGAVGAVVGVDTTTHRCQVERMQ